MWLLRGVLSPPIPPKQEHERYGGTRGYCCPHPCTRRRDPATFWPTLSCFSWGPTNRCLIPSSAGPPGDPGRLQGSVTIALPSCLGPAPRLPMEPEPRAEGRGPSWALLPGKGSPPSGGMRRPGAARCGTGRCVGQLPRVPGSPFPFAWGHGRWRSSPRGCLPACTPALQLAEERGYGHPQLLPPCFGGVPSSPCSPETRLPSWKWGRVVMGQVEGEDPAPQTVNMGAMPPPASCSAFPCAGGGQIIPRGSALPAPRCGHPCACSPEGSNPDGEEPGLCRGKKK